MTETAQILKTSPLVGKNRHRHQGTDHLIHVKSEPLGYLDLPFPRCHLWWSYSKSSVSGRGMPYTSLWLSGNFLLVSSFCRLYSINKGLCLWTVASQLFNQNHHSVNMILILEQLRSPQGKICIIPWLGLGYYPKQVFWMTIFGGYMLIGCPKLHHNYRPSLPVTSSSLDALKPNWLFIWIMHFETMNECFSWKCYKQQTTNGML